MLSSRTQRPNWIKAPTEAFHSDQVLSQNNCLANRIFGFGFRLVSGLGESLPPSTSIGHEFLKKL